MAQIDDQLWFHLNTVTNYHFLNIISRLDVLVPNNDLTNIRDVYEKCSAIIVILSDGTITDRLLSRCISYLKQHANNLRHGLGVASKAKIITLKTIQITTKNIEDMSLCFEEKKKVELIAKSKEFYEDYTSYFVENNINLNPSLKKTLAAYVNLGYELPIEGQPPKGQTMEWYKLNGWSEFFIGRTIIFLSGSYPNLRCKVNRLNSNSTGCIFEDGSRHSISRNVPLTWE